MPSIQLARQAALQVARGCVYRTENGSGKAQFFSQFKAAWNTNIGINEKYGDDMKNVTCVHLFAAALATLFSVDVRAQNATAESAWNLVESCQFWLAIESGEADKKFQKNDVASVGVTMVRAGYCPGYINGFIGGRSMGKSPGSSLAFCVPKEVTTSQVARLLVKKLEEKPEFEHVSSLAFISGVLAATWPCGNK